MPSASSGDLTIVAPFTGRLVAPNLHELPDTFVQRGQEIGRVAVLDKLVIKGDIDQKDFQLVHQMPANPKIEIRLVRPAGRKAIAGGELTSAARGRDGTGKPNPSVRVAGGDMQVDPRDPNGLRTQASHFRGPRQAGQPRANSFTPASAPTCRLTLDTAAALAWQWTNSFLQLIQSHDIGKVAVDQCRHASPPTNSGPIFDARRVKAPELRGTGSSSSTGSSAGSRTSDRVLVELMAQADRDRKARAGDSRTRLSSDSAKRWPTSRDLARLGRLKGEPWIAPWRLPARRRSGPWACGRFPSRSSARWPCSRACVAEMATGEGKTLTASLAAAIWAWHGKPVHIITVNDYLVARDAEEMGPVYNMLGLQRRPRHPRNDAQDRHRPLPPQRRLRHQQGTGRRFPARPDRPGQPPHQHADRRRHADERQRSRAACWCRDLFRVIVDEADSLLIDEGVTPLIISNSPRGRGQRRALSRRRRAGRSSWKLNRDFTIDWTVCGRSI